MATALRAESATSAPARAPKSRALRAVPTTPEDLERLREEVETAKRTREAAARRRLFPRLPISLDQPALLAPGVHVAPCFSLFHLPMLVVIDEHQRLAGLVEVTNLSGDRLVSLASKERDEDQDIGSAVFVVDTGLFVDRMIYNHAFALSGHALAPVGLSVAPWRPQVLEEGTVYIGCDQESRLHFLYEAMPGEDVARIARQFERVVAEHTDSLDEGTPLAKVRARLETERDFCSPADLEEDLEHLRTLPVRPEFLVRMEDELRSARWRKAERQQAPGAAR